MDHAEQGNYKDFGEETKQKKILMNLVENLRYTKGKFKLVEIKCKLWDKIGRYFIKEIYDLIEGRGLLDRDIL